MSEPSPHGPRTLENARQWMHARLAKRIHPLGLTDPEATAATIDRLQGLDGENWAAAWMETARSYLTRAEGAERSGDVAAARAHYYQAYGFFFLGRFPVPNHPAKQASYEYELDAYLKFGRLCNPPIERVTIPFSGGPGEGTELAFYVRRPRGIEKPKCVITWGGLDAWKEEATELSNALLGHSLATIAVDNAGTGESPVRGGPDAERQFLPLLDWTADDDRLTGVRPAILGRSFGGLWATKLAHLYPDRVGAAVSWGGGAHYMFQREWIERSRYPDSYLMELVEVRQRMLGATNDDEYIERFAKLSLLDQGVLERRSAPLLLVNGKDDAQVPIADIHLLTEHGDPKAVRLFPGGHMGFGPQTVPTIAAWIKRTLDAC
jgi:pimeloyl-ACP methyl ester carboxylesterase